MTDTKRIYLKRVSRMFFILAVSLVFPVMAFGQTDPPRIAAPTPLPSAKLSELLANNLKTRDLNAVVERAEREQAYAKLLEGQRYVWNITSLRRGRTQAGNQYNARMARQALKEALEFDPTLAEAYTLLAELSISAPPTDVDEAINLARIAIQIEPNNFGARRILGRLYTFKSGLGSDRLNSTLADSAVEEWKNVARLDPRNAEAWAFLSEFYLKKNKENERIDALQKWLSSATPIDAQFYQRVMGGSESLSPENASIKLGAAFLKAGRTQEAVETISLVIADDPQNGAAIDLLREALESSRDGSAAVAIQSLQQAVYANPGNFALVNLLSDVHARSGNFDEAAKVLRDASAKAAASDKVTAAAFQVSLGDLYSRAERYSESLAGYEEAIAIRGFAPGVTFSDDQREFLIRVFEKIILTQKAANRPNDVRSTIERARKLLGTEDLFADRQLISFYRETGKRQEALAVVRAVRVKFAQDDGMMRLESTLLTELGKVDEAVANVKKNMAAKTAAPATRTDGGSFTVGLPGMDDFSNYLFISNLYSQANRGKEAAEAANQAYTVARGAERRQIAKLTLATAQQLSGDFAVAEATLRDILKESPGNPIALNNLGYFLLERNERFEEALDLIQRAVRIDPTNPSYLDSLGWAYFKLGKIQDAEKYLKEALRYDSTSSTIHEHVGDVYKKQGKADLAKVHWQKALNLASEKAEIDRIKLKLK